MANRYNESFNDGHPEKEHDDYDNVDLFDLSRRRQQAEMISQSVDEEYDDYNVVRGSSTGKRNKSDSVTGKYPDASFRENYNVAENYNSYQVDTTYNGEKSEKKSVKLSGFGLNKLVKFVLIAAALCVIIGIVLINSAISGMNYVEVDTDWTDVKSEDAPNWALRSEMNVTNILLLGIDGDGGSSQRSDTIMILTLDGRNNVIKMTSILRDTYVSIPGRDSKTRINHAYAYGGAALTMQTIESNFRIDIDRYIGIDMDGLSVVVESLGGVDIELSASEAKVINANVQNSSLTEGKNHLNGAQATYYARIRKIDSDFGRTGRQRKLIKAMISSFKDLNVVAQYSLVSEVTPYLTTNYSKPELMMIAVKAMGMIGSETQEMSVPVDGSYQSKTISGMAVLVPDIDKNCREMHNFIFGSIPD